MALMESEAVIVDPSLTTDGDLSKVFRALVDHTALTPEPSPAFFGYREALAWPPCTCRFAMTTA